MNGWSSLTRRATILSFLLAVALFVAVMAVKYRVQQLDDELIEINRQIAAERQSVHVLSAEFSFLIKPERLRRLATEYLGLVPIKPDQLGTFATLDQLPVEGETMHADGAQPLPGVRPTAATELRR
jgi:cell division protein FtsL